ncbi:MAG: Intracellular exo-alpha-(1-_5)-L-arabinofuranosidase [Verrucomicrobiales bacterium]|nr:Intracellular exo-alpha-(1->5)-L-arabinofuranosidase [Verrucomicrobiales bacterium]
MKKQNAVLWLSVAFLAFRFQTFAEPLKATLTVHAQPLHNGRVNPMLCGNFVELLNDLVPAMSAEMLNDRSFEGVTKSANWVYYDGAPDFCDREWDRNGTWTNDTASPFNGVRSARLSSQRGHLASLTQSGLATRKAMRYAFSGFLRSDSSSLKVSVVLKVLLPDGTAVSLASAKLPALSREWKKYSVPMIASGQSDRVVFELRVEGQGNVWADKLSLMPGDNLNGWRPDVIQAIKETRPALIRWGGSVCDPGEYRWKAGIGDRDARTPFRNKVWGRIDSNDVGIDEFCQFCELVQAEPLVCISFSDGAQSAADLVEYCNGSATTIWGAKRAANGHPAPYHVKYWQIGNEIGGDNEEYLNHFAAFVEAMKNVDPAVVLAASFPSQKLLDRAGKYISYIGPHHYTPDFAGCDRDFNTLSEMIAKTPGCSHIRIAVTEWNVSAGSWGLLRGKFLTLETALLNARYLNLLMRHSDKADIACRSNMANSFGSGIIETRPDGLLKRPSYYVMQLYAQHHKPVPLRIDSAVEGLDLFTCGSEDLKKVVVFAINSKTEPVECSLAFEGFGELLRVATVEAVCDVQDARQPDVMNHWMAPDRIKTIRLSPMQNRIVLPALSAVAIECGTF